MENKKEMTIPNVSAATDAEQSLSKCTDNSIVNQDTDFKGYEQSFEEMQREILRQLDPSYLKTVSMTTLYDTVFEVQTPLIDGLLQRGTYLFVGSPKVGKSFMMAQLAYHISTGTPLWEYKVRKATVLYFALEDDYPRLQKRLFQMFGAKETGNLYFATECKTVNGGLAAFPTAYFEKDNDVKNGSKGDFIFREDVDGIEFISIMFEMKNEMDETATKHKNEDFFKELDRDRREKGCEYAVLVSLLEIDNELYSNGIVDVSYKYEKMYVIRPQFFIPMITLLRNAALNSLKYRQELELVRNQQIDILRFEENMNTFKDGFTRNYRIASEKFKTAIDEIDKTISHLQKTKEALLSSENQLRLANNKAEDLSIKKLTKDAPAVKEMFDKVSNNRNIE